MPNKSQDLARQVAANPVTFSNLEGCAAELPTNENPLVIKYNQLFLVRQGKGLNSPYLSYSPFLDLSDLNDPKRKSMADSLAANILDGIPTKKDIQSGLIPDPDKRDRGVEKKNILVQKGIVESTEAANSNRIYTEYKKHIAQKVKNEVNLAHNFYAQAFKIAAPDFANPVKLSKAIAADLLDPFYSASPTRYKVAFFALYAQEWKPAGYTRGDLIKSLSLCPGETVTLEYHYWDKSIIKNEEELSSDLELKSSSTLTQRDSKELLDELTKNNQVKLDANSQISVPLPPVTITGGDAANLTAQIQPHTSSAIKSSVENVVSVSNDFKQTRKIRIEETRDTGREEKQTRVVANTNRCHTLEFRYFEILTNYLVTSSCVGFEACLLLPFRVVCDGKTFSCKTIDGPFILCNEHVLKRVLIDSKFAAGFEAARKVESFKKLKTLFAENVAASNSAASPSTTGDQQAIDQEYEAFRTSILGAYAALNGAADDVVNAFKNLNANDILGGLGGILLSIATAVRRFPAWVAIHIDADTNNAIEALRRSRKPARQAMRDFFAVVSENDFQFINPVTGDVADALEQLGVPFSDQIAGAIFDLGIIGGVVNTVKDDAGLHDAVQAAQSFFESTDKAPTGKVTTPPAGTDGSTALAASQTPTVADLVSLNDIADAQVEVDRLICHIQCNCDYYKQALWLSKGPDYRAAFLVKAQVSQFVSNEVVGFYGDCAAFPITDASFLKKALNVPQLLQSLADKMPKDVSELVTVPTSSTVMTGQLGECDLCEAYIDQSRDADVRQQNAKAALDEAEAGYKNAKTHVAEQEALRIAARLAAQPPDLSDPIEHAGAKLDIAVTTQDTNP